MAMQTVTRGMQNFGNHFLPLDAKMQVLADRASTIPYTFAEGASTLWTHIDEHEPRIQQQIDRVKQHPRFTQAAALVGRAKNFVNHYLPSGPKVYAIFKKLGLCSNETRLDILLANRQAVLDPPKRFADKVVEMAGKNKKEEADLKELHAKAAELANNALQAEGKTPQSAAKLATQAALKTFSLWGMRAGFVYGSARVLQSVTGLFTSRIPLIGGLTTTLTSWGITAVAVATFTSWVWAVYKNEPRKNELRLEVINSVEDRNLFFAQNSLEKIGEHLQTFANKHDLLKLEEGSPTLQSQIMSLTAENFFAVKKKRKDD